MDLTAHVPRDLWDLMPAFLRNRREEAECLRAAWATTDVEILTRLAERMYALGNPYGFRQITTFGRALREAIAMRRWAVIRQLALQYEDYLSEVTLVQVDAPVTRSVWRQRAAERRAAELAAPPEGFPERRRHQRRGSAAGRQRLGL